jgi:hypothetical protein
MVMIFLFLLVWVSGINLLGEVIAGMKKPAGLW